MQQKLVFLIGVCALLLGGCASKKKISSSDAVAELEKTYTPKVGSATKADLIEHFGNPNWCRPSESSDEETCRFYFKKSTQWLGDKKDRAHYEAYDEVFAGFDAKGLLKTFKASAQR